MQYFKPPGLFYVGDCMPFSHAGIFHLFYLLDENHHRGNRGLGGHQWAHASTPDLVNWTHHPLALPITESWEGSICTGSVLFHEDVYYAYYATRMPDRTQHLGLALSRDGIVFEKQLPNPFMSAPEGYNPADFRDPFVFRDDTGRFQMLVTSRLREPPLHDRGGCLLRFESDDLKSWSRPHLYLQPGGRTGGAGIPECPDCFFWKGWYYLLFGLGMETHYRMSRELTGPWIEPANNILSTSMEAVMKTAPFGDGRRIGAAWIPARKDDKDDGPLLWGGNLVLRELVQHADGTLGTRTPPEVALPAGDSLEPQCTYLTSGASGDFREIRLQAESKEEVAALEDLPLRYRLRCSVVPEPGTMCFGLGLKGSGEFETKNDLVFHPHKRKVTLATSMIELVEGLEHPFELEVVVFGDIVDVCIGGHRCLVDRLSELVGKRLFFFCVSGAVRFQDISITAL